MQKLSIVWFHWECAKSKNYLSFTDTSNKQTNKKQAFYRRSVLSYQVVLPVFVLKESGGCGVIKNESVENIYLERIQMSVPGEGRKNYFQQLYECL